MSHSHEHDHAYMHEHGIAHSHGHVHENQKAVVNRLARAIGHLDKVKRMVEEGCDCSEVLIQLAAVRSAIDNTGKVILQDHMRHCMVDAVSVGDMDAVEDLCRAIGHLEKVKRMVEEGYDCTEVLVQLAAVRSAIDNTGKVILQDHMRHCMVDAVAEGDHDAIEDLCKAIERYMK